MYLFCPILRWLLAGGSFYGQCSTWRAGRPDQGILLVWPNVYTTVTLVPISHSQEMNLSS